MAGQYMTIEYGQTVRYIWVGMSILIRRSTCLVIQHFQHCLPHYRLPNHLMEDHETELWVKDVSVNNTKNKVDTECGMQSKRLKLRQESGHVLITRLVSKFGHSKKLYLQLIQAANMSTKEESCLSCDIYVKLDLDERCSKCEDDCYLILTVFTTEEVMCNYTFFDHSVLGPRIRALVKTLPEVSTWRRTDFPIIP